MIRQQIHCDDDDDDDEQAEQDEELCVWVVFAVDSHTVSECEEEEDLKDGKL